MADQRRPEVSAEDLVAVVRVHGDRVHDAVRRLGCSPAAAVEVVEASALDLVDVVARTPSDTTDLVGWWFARARALGHAVADNDPDLPLGGGLLAADEDQQLIAEVLERLPERERVALLLRDSYDLPAASVGAALGTDADAAMEVVGRARLAFLPELDDTDLPVVVGHDLALGALARLAMPGPVAARDATTKRHAQSCAVCGGVLDAQERAHLLLAGISVVALPEPERDALLVRVEGRARSSLPAAADLAAADELVEEEDLEPRRLLTPLTALAGLVLSVLLGVGLGALLSRDPSVVTAGRDPGALPAVTADPAPTLPPVPTGTASPTPTPTAFPSGGVFTITPAPEPTTAPPTTAPPTSAPAQDPLALSIDPSRGPNGATLTVNGTGWLPGSTVTVVYYDTLGRRTPSESVADVDARGRFTTQLAAQDPTNVPGEHEIRASNGSQQASATYQATA